MTGQGACLEPNGRPGRGRTAGGLPTGFAQLPHGTALQARVYLEARHGFDVSDLPSYAKFGSETLGYNAAADAAAVREVEQFISRKTD